MPVFFQLLGGNDWHGEFLTCLGVEQGVSNLDFLPRPCERSYNAIEWARLQSISNGMWGIERDRGGSQLLRRCHIPSGNSTFKLPARKHTDPYPTRVVCPHPRKLEGVAETRYSAELHKNTEINKIKKIIGSQRKLVGITNLAADMEAVFRVTSCKYITMT